MFEYRAPIRDEDQAGADGFACLQRRGSKGARRPRELRLQVINSNKDAVAELGRHARFESQTTIRDLLDTTLEMIDLKFDKGHDLSNMVLLLRAATELPKEVVAELTVALTQTPRECLGVVYIPNVGEAVALQPLDYTRAMAVLGLSSQA